MEKTFIEIAIGFGLLGCLATPAFATQIMEKPIAKNPPAETGQNAFTRAIKKPLSGILSPVPNPHTTPCYSVVDCRKKGDDLETIWQFDNSVDHSPKDYPENCYTLGENGKYIYSVAACHHHQ